MNATRDPIVADLFLARYERGGRGPATFDCFGLFAEVCRRRGIELPTHPSPDDLRLREAAILDEAAHWVALESPQPWCAVAFRIGPFVSHLGVVLADGLHFMHASRRVGIATDRLDSPLWAKRIAGYYRHA